VGRFPITLVGFAKGSWAGTDPDIGVSRTPPDAGFAIVTWTVRLLPEPIEVWATPSESLTENPELLAAMTLSSGFPGVTIDTAPIKHFLLSLR
jgi:hypothetical protein